MERNTSLVTALLLLALGSLATAQVVWCPDLFTLIGNTACLHVNPQTKTWDDGRAYCQGLNDGSFATDLAVIEDCEVMNSLWNFIVHKLNKRMNYWIGATDKDSEGTWQWLTGTHVQGDVPFWFPEQPDGSNMENCLTIAENGYFADGACNQEYGVICQAPVMTTFRNLE